MIWVETPTNPLLRLADLSAIAALAKKHYLLAAADNTFASPYVQRPLEHGFDIVMHSTTKYLNGHSDIVGGCVVTKDADLTARLRSCTTPSAASPARSTASSPCAASRTLALRMERHCANALKIAAWLETHPKVARVIYPGLESHPQHALAKKQMHGFGGIVSFFVRGGLAATKRVLERTQLFTLAESLGGVESLIEHPAIMTHASIPPEQRARIGISDELVRLSVGIEDADDLVADLEQALQ